MPRWHSGAHGGSPRPATGMQGATSGPTPDASERCHLRHPPAARQHAKASAGCGSRAIYPSHQEPPRGAARRRRTRPGRLASPPPAPAYLIRAGLYLKYVYGEEKKENLKAHIAGANENRAGFSRRASWRSTRLVGGDFVGVGMTAGGAASFYGSAALIRPVRREDRGGQGLRLRLAAGCAIVFALACVLTTSDGGARWREKADMMLAARTAYRTTAGTADISAALQRLPAGRTTALDEAAADPAAPEDGAAADSPAAGDGATADTAAQEDAGAASAENATEGSGGCPPMDGGNTWGTSFECWLASYEDPEDVEDWVQAHRASHKFSSAQWYQDHKNASSYGGVDTDEWYAAARRPGSVAGLHFEPWYSARKSFGNFSWPSWVDEHGLKAEYMAHSRLDILAELSSQLDGYSKAKERCGLECWMAQFRHRSQLAAVHRWFKSHRGDKLQALRALEMQVQKLQFQKWYQEHKDFGGPMMNTETWYESEKNTTAGLNFDDWYREHKDFGGPEMDTEVWYANHRLGPNGTSLFKQADIVRSVLLWEVVRSIEEHSLLKKLKAASTQAPARVGAAAPVSASQVRQQTLAASTPEHFSLFTWLANEPAAADLLSQANVIKAGTTDKGKMTQDVSDYLDSKTSLDLDTWLAKETGTEEGEEEVEGTMATNPEVKQKKTANVLGKWMNRHISPKLGRWLESFTRTSSPFRAAANSRLAKNALEKDVASLHMDALHSRLAGQRRVQSLQTATAANESGDANSPDFDFETWWAALGSNQPGVAGSNWTKLTPEADSAEISASDTVGSGSCCCGFACEQISNECCGAWYPANGESYMHYGSFKQNPRSIAALSARANAARLQQRSASAQVSMLQQLSAHAPGQELPSLLARAAVTEGEAAVDADAAQRADAALRRDNALKTVKARLSTLLQVAQPKNAKAAVVAAAPKATKASTLREMKMAHAAPKPVTTQVHQAYGDKGFLGWMCAADTCIAAPVRVGASCEVEALSADGVSPLSASGGCMTEAARASDKSKAVQCGAKMAKASGSTGYDDPSHWCHCAAKTLASQIKSCRGGAADEGGGTRGAVFANGLTFGPNVAFADGDTFGDSEVFGEGDSFGSMDKFGSKNKFAKRTKFGMDDKFGDGNEFGEGSVFGRGAKLGDGNKIGAHVEFHGDVVLGAQNDVGRGSSFGRHAKIGRGTILSRHTELASDANLGDKTVVGDGSSIGTGAVIGAKVQIGKRVTLEGVARMGPGTEIGQGSSFDVGTSTLHTTAEPPATAGGAKTAEALEAGAGADEGGKEEADGATSAEDGSEKAEGEEGEEGDETEYYRPDPGSPFAREGSPLMTMRLDGHNHWPVYLPWENEEAAGEGDAEGEGEEGGEDSGSGSAE